MSLLGPLDAKEAKAVRRFVVAEFFVSKEQCSHFRIFPGVDIFTAHGEHMTVSLVEMEPHAVVEEHSHPHEQMGMMLEGQAEFIVGGRSYQVRAGQMYFIPGGMRHKVVAGDRSGKALDVFHPIREDYRK